MSCDKESLGMNFQLRLRVWTRMRKNRTGKAVGVAGVEFFDITVHPLAIPIYARTKPRVFQDDGCGLKSFLEMVRSSKKLPFVAVRNDAHWSAYTRLRTAEQNQEKLPSAFLYVFERGRLEATSIGVNLDKITVLAATESQQDYSVFISGETAKSVNF